LLAVVGVAGGSPRLVIPKRGGIASRVRVAPPPSPVSEGDHTSRFRRTVTLLVRMFIFADFFFLWAMVGLLAIQGVGARLHTVVPRQIGWGLHIDGSHQSVATLIYYKLEPISC
jgi:hypothetical protein